MYDFRTIESKWLKRWEESGIFNADIDNSKPKLFITFPYPYMNGPLHLGHAYTAVRADIYARYKRMKGYNVLYPWAWHWTGEPIVGMAKRVREGDKLMINLIINIDKVPESELPKFTDPLYIAKYYTKRGREDLPLLGLSIDWRREFMTTDFNPGYSKFIEWQYRKLLKKGLVIKATHPVVWCPRDRSPTGDHDRLEGEGVRPERYYVIKFPSEKGLLAAATLRPETIFGVTNIWVNPEAIYVRARVNDEVWIISKETIEKLREQLYEVKVLEEFKGEKLIGLKVKDPMNFRELIILPAKLVAPDVGTGVVYSVPSHAPYDWLGLRDLIQSPDELAKYGLDPAVLNMIKPISIIKVEGFGEHPAIEVVDKLRVRNQLDPKAEEATKIVYREEYHKGIMKENCGRYSGMAVKDAKNAVAEELEKKRMLNYLYDLPEPVICRCGTRCIVKILENQWFLKYSDSKWKNITKEHVKRMNIYPEEARNWLIGTIDWLEDKACARKSGFGTKLPWDKEWIIEPLSDSTIYMAYYIISKYINDGRIKDPSKLNDEFFDYVLLGIGDPRDVSETTGIPVSTIISIREEFTYWYPVDLRVSGKDLLSNHLVFFLLHHVAIFPQDLWPRGISANGFVSINGKPLSKRKGNVVTIREAVERYGGDTTRLALISSADGLDDPDWRDKVVNSTLSFLKKMYSLFKQLLELLKMQPEPLDDIDKWLLSKLQKRIIEVSEAIENMKLRSGAISAFYELYNDVTWYLRRKEKPNAKVISELLETWIRLIAPYTPFIAEELWHLFGKEEFVSTIKWPEPQRELINEEYELQEELVIKYLADIRDIVSKDKRYKYINIYIPASWKYEVLMEVSKYIKRGANIKDVIRELMREERYRKLGKKAVELIQKYYKEYWSLTDIQKRNIEKLMQIEERAIKSMKWILKKEFGVELRIWKEGEGKIYDPLRKAERALPFKPGLYLE